MARREDKMDGKKLGRVVRSITLTGRLARTILGARPARRGREVGEADGRGFWRANFATNSSANLNVRRR